MKVVKLAAIGGDGSVDLLTGPIGAETQEEIARGNAKWVGGVKVGELSDEERQDVAEGLMSITSFDSDESLASAIREWVDA